MTHRTFDEQIANFNRVVSSWDINQEYKVALLGMIASLGYEHEKSITPEPHWIPVTERYPEENDYRPCYGYEDGAVWWRNDTGLMGLGWYYQSTDKWAYYDELDRCEKCVGNVVEWMPLPEPYKGVTT